MGIGLAPEAIGFFLDIGVVFFVVGVDPLGDVLAGLDLKIGVNFPIVAGDEFADQLFTRDHHRQSGGLHATHRRQKKPAIARVKGGKGARAVDAHQPIGLGA